jgi:spermidine synthase
MAKTQTPPAKATPAPSPSSAPSTSLLGTLVFLTGAVILVLEIVGARLVSPVYGSSLNVWSSLITVTLLALALGYETGGRLADRFPAHTTLQWLLGTAGAAILLIPSLRKPVLDATAHLGLQVGALAASAILLLLPLVLLSAAGLVVARAVTRSLEQLGRGVGRVSFYSTLGSVAGALATGFFLIPRFPVSRIFYGAGALVLAAMALVALDQRRRVAAAAHVLVAVGAGLIPLARPEPVAAHVTFETETFYGHIAVVEAHPQRYLMVDGIHQSLWDTRTQENYSEYIRALELGALASHGDRALVIGVGAGTLPVILERYHGMVADSVDINPAVVDAARRFFAFKTEGRTTIEDGRTFIQRCPAASYDLVVLDTFNGDAIPYHLLTREFFTEVARVLRPNGVVGVNTVGLRGKGGVSGDIRAVAATLAAAVPRMRAFALTPPREADDAEDLENVVIFGSRGPLDPGPPEGWRAGSRDVLARAVRQELDAAAIGGGLVLTDDYNPIDFLHAPTAREWRARVLELTS